MPVIAAASRNTDGRQSRDRAYDVAEGASPAESAAQPVGLRRKQPLPRFSLVGYRQIRGQWPLPYVPYGLTAMNIWRVLQVVRPVTIEVDVIIVDVAGKT
jgi:hypothetical protein